MFTKHQLMSWNELESGRLAVLADDGSWRDYTHLPAHLKKPNPGDDPRWSHFGQSSRGYATMQLLLSKGWKFKGEK